MLFVAYCVVCVACCVLIVISWIVLAMLFDLWCPLFVVRCLCLLCVACWLLFVERCVLLFVPSGLSVVRCLVAVVSCVLFVVC